MCLLSIVTVVFNWTLIKRVVVTAEDTDESEKPL